MRASALMLPFLTLPVLAGCASKSSLPGKIPVDALSSMFTTTSAHDVATCIAQAVGSTADNDGAGYRIAARSGNSYSIGANTERSVYPTQVIVRGVTINTEESEKATLCLRSNGNAD